MPSSAQAADGPDAMAGYSRPGVRRLWNWRVLLYVVCALICVFLIVPVLVIFPLSFNASEYFSFPIKSYSLRWYAEFFGDPKWQAALWKSLQIGVLSTIVSTFLGTAASLGMRRLSGPLRAGVLAVFLAPLVVPLVVSAVGLFYVFARLHLVGTVTGIVIAHSILAIPFVVITVTAALSKFDPVLERAGLSLGAGPVRVFFTVTLPAIRAGVVSGAIFAFVTSWDEVVAVIFIATAQQFTIPRLMWSGVRENISPTLLAAAVVITAVSLCLMLCAALIRRSDGGAER